MKKNNENQLLIFYGNEGHVKEIRLSCDYRNIITTKFVIYIVILDLLLNMYSIHLYYQNVLLQQIYRFIFAPNFLLITTQVFSVFERWEIWVHCTTLDSFFSDVKICFKVTLAIYQNTHILYNYRKKYNNDTLETIGIFIRSYDSFETKILEYLNTFLPKVQ